MNKFKLIIVLSIAVLFSSCSVDEDIEPIDQTKNGFNYKGSFFSVDKAFIKDFNIIDNEPSNIAIVLSNVDPSRTNPKWGGVNYFYFAYEATNVIEGTITPVPQYSIRENADFENLSILAGNTILRYNDPRVRNIAVSSSVNIKSISVDEIDLEFEFIRPDGEIITGSYKGTYE
ncbi:hypothetical protein [uncultured Cyclobacterium sp.]|uniref:hypothetical protein n=1 Tax=uncultured Cyclobacterium sp. TaxID=453820 RepID=UPI0030EDCB25|tara:strand:+ start:66114 stop:66635 length:522 start_codon:yes stop_codon:yes gene_type:complete